MNRFVLGVFLVLSVSLSAQGQDQSEEPVQRVKAGIHAPVPTVTPEAEMPDAARRAHRGGICIFSLIVDAKGNPQNPHLVRCTDTAFLENSMDAVKKYRFKPAYRISDGTPVPVMITVEINFRFGDGPSPAEPPTQIRYAFISPPGMTSVGPDSQGVYPLSKQLDAPVMKEFVSRGFGNAAKVFPDGVGCHVILTLTEKGKPQDAQVLDCDKPTLKDPAVDSLMKSQYKPAKLNGTAVPVRMTVHLIYDGFGPHKEDATAAGSGSSQP